MSDAATRRPSSLSRAMCRSSKAPARDEAAATVPSSTFRRRSGTLTSDLIPRRRHVSPSTRGSAWVSAQTRRVLAARVRHGWSGMAPEPEVARRREPPLSVTSTTTPSAPLSRRARRATRSSTSSWSALRWTASIRYESRSRMDMPAVLSAKPRSAARRAITLSSASSALSSRSEA